MIFTLCYTNINISSCSECLNQSRSKQSLKRWKDYLLTYSVFFSTKKCALYLKKNAILCLFLKHVSPSKWVECMFYSK